MCCEATDRDALKLSFLEFYEFLESSVMRLGGMLSVEGDMPFECALSLLSLLSPSRRQSTRDGTVITRWEMLRSSKTPALQNRHK